VRTGVGAVELARRLSPLRPGLASSACGLVVGVALAHEPVAFSWDCVVLFAGFRSAALNVLSTLGGWGERGTGGET
jgi:hypothetical protein